MEYASFQPGRAEYVALLYLAHCFEHRNRLVAPPNHNSVRRLRLLERLQKESGSEPEGDLEPWLERRRLILAEERRRNEEETQALLKPCGLEEALPQAQWRGREHVEPSQKARLATVWKKAQVHGLGGQLEEHALDALDLGGRMASLDAICERVNDTDVQTK